MTTKEHELSPIKRKFLALLMAAPDAERTAVMQLLFLWKNGAGPDKAAADIWLHNKAAEIKVRRLADGRAS